MHRRQCYPAEWALGYLASGITIGCRSHSAFGRHIGPGTGQATLLSPEDKIGRVAEIHARLRHKPMRDLPLQNDRAAILLPKMTSTLLVYPNCSAAELRMQKHTHKA